MTVAEQVKMRSSIVPRLRAGVCFALILSAGAAALGITIYYTIQLHTGLSELRTNLDPIVSDVGTLNKDVGTLNEDVKELKSAVPNYKIGSLPGTRGYKLVPDNDTGEYDFTPLTPSDPYPDATFHQIPGLEATIKTRGRPVIVSLLPSPDRTSGDNKLDSYLWLKHPEGASPETEGTSEEKTMVNIRVKRDHTVVADFLVASNGNDLFPSSAIQLFDEPDAGTHTYSVQLRMLEGSGSFYLNRTRLLVREI